VVQQKCEQMTKSERQLEEKLIGMAGGPASGTKSYTTFIEKARG